MSTLTTMSAKAPRAADSKIADSITPNSPPKNASPINAIGLDIFGNLVESSISPPASLRACQTTPAVPLSSNRLNTVPAPRLNPSIPNKPKTAAIVPTMQRTTRQFNMPQTTPNISSITLALHSLSQIFIPPVSSSKFHSSAPDSPCPCWPSWQAQQRSQTACLCHCDIPPPCPHWQP